MPTGPSANRERRSLHLLAKPLRWRDVSVCGREQARHHLFQRRTDGAWYDLCVFTACFPAFI